MKKTLICAVAAMVLVFGIVSAANALLIDTLYVTDGDAARLAIIEGSTATIVNTYYRGYSLAVRDTIWIADYNTANDAIEYDLNGNPTGNSVAYTPIDAVDGASNGNINYALGDAFYGGSATIYSANTDWTNLTSMFTVYGDDLVGITYDSVQDSLWISDRHFIYEYSISGDLLSQFAHSSGRGSLAYEMSSDTLWYVQNHSDLIYQYSKDGTLLDTVTVSGLDSNNWGAEFSSVPEPATVCLLGMGGLALLRRRR